MHCRPSGDDQPLVETTIEASVDLDGDISKEEWAVIARNGSDRSPGLNRFPSEFYNICSGYNSRGFCEDG